MKTTEKYSTALCYQSTHPPLDVLLQQNTEPIILAFELEVRKAAGLPGCFLTWARLVKKGFPGTDTELTRHFVTLFADRHWWGVSIYTSGGCLPDSGGFCSKFCIPAATIVFAVSSTIDTDAALQQMDLLKFFLRIQFTFIEIGGAGKPYFPNKNSEKNTPCFPLMKNIWSNTYPLLCCLFLA